MQKYPVFILAFAFLSACTTTQIQETEPLNAKKAAVHHNANKAEHLWNLNDLYTDDAAWEKRKKEMDSKLEGFAGFKGSITRDAKTLADALEARTTVEMELLRLSSYANKRSDVDMRDPHALEMKQSVGTLKTRFNQATSFYQPEILKADKQKIDLFVAKEKRLAPYDRYLKDTLRSAPHTLDESGEKILATSGLISNTASTLYEVLTNADIPWPTITLSDGEVVRLDQSGYEKYRSSSNRGDRIRVFEAFWSTLRKYEQTLGVTLYAHVKKDFFYAQVRDYENTLSRSLDANNVPSAVYYALIDATNANLDTLHRYFRLRARMLDIDDLHYHDIYPPLVETDLEFPIEKGKELVLESLKPLGGDYAATVAKGFEERWMDTYPRPGKRSGAYSSGSAYDVHPYVLMNYTDDYSSVSTLAHEWGHTMQSYLTNKTQPFPKADYSTFVAEVASTFNEALLLDYVLKHARSDEEKLYYLGSALEGLRGTFYRQAMFAEFELRIHQLVEEGEALSGDRLTRIYSQIVRRYHGHDAGIMEVDDLYTIEWAFIPHFYYNYYVYQYATSIAAASLFAKDVLDGKEGAVEHYLGVLKAGGSEYPYQALTKAGVDLASPAPYEALVTRMNAIMDEIESILDKKKYQTDAMDRERGCL